MNLQREQIDASHAKHTYFMASEKERDEWCKVYPDSMPSTHRLAYRWLERTDKPPMLPARLEVWPEEIPIQDVAIASEHFARLSVSQLRWLVQRHGLSVSKDKPEKGQMPDERNELIRILRERFPLTAQVPQVAVEGVPAEGVPAEATVIPPEIADLPDDFLEAKAGELQIKNYPRRSSRAKRLEVIALAMQRTEKVAA
jgi:hypothetical protein